MTILTVAHAFFVCSLSALDATSHTQMTPVRAATTLFMRHKAVAEAITGSGMTSAFVIPILDWSSVSSRTAMVFLKSRPSLGSRYIHVEGRDTHTSLKVHQQHLSRGLQYKKSDPRLIGLSPDRPNLNLAGYVTSPYGSLIKNSSASPPTQRSFVIGVGIRPGQLCPSFEREQYETRSFLYQHSFRKVVAKVWN